MSHIPCERTNNIYFQEVCTMNFKLNKALQELESFNQKTMDYNSSHWHEKDWQELDEASVDLYKAVYDLIECVQNIQEYMLKNL